MSDANIREASDRFHFSGMPLASFAVPDSILTSMPCIPESKARVESWIRPAEYLKVTDCRRGAGVSARRLRGLPASVMFASWLLFLARIISRELAAAYLFALCFDPYPGMAQTHDRCRHRNRVPGTKTPRLLFHLRQQPEG